MWKGHFHSETPVLNQTNTCAAEGGGENNMNCCNPDAPSFGALACEDSNRFVRQDDVSMSTLRKADSPGAKASAVRSCETHSDMLAPARFGMFDSVPSSAPSSPPSTPTPPCPTLPLSTGSFTRQTQSVSVVQKTGRSRTLCFHNLTAGSRDGCLLKKPLEEEHRGECKPSEHQSGEGQMCTQLCLHFLSDLAYSIARVWSCSSDARRAAPRKGALCL